MFCPNCAQSVADGSKFCEYCGFPLVPTQSVAQPEPVAQPESEEVSTTVQSASDYTDSMFTYQPDADMDYQPEPVSYQQPEPTVSYQQPVEPVSYQQPTQSQPVAYQQPPQYQQAPQYQQSNQYQQPQYAQPQQYQQTPAAPQMPTYAQPVASGENKGMPVWVKVIIGLLIALVLFGIGKLLWDNWLRAMINGGSETTTTTENNTIFNIENIFGTDTGSTDILDSHNNPTVYAFMNKKGSEIADAVEEMGWDFDDDALIWESEDGNNGYYVCGDDDYEFTEDDIDDMAPNGGSKACVITILVDDQLYSSLQQVVDKLCTGIVIDEEVYDDVIYRVMETESGEQDFVMITYNSYNELYRIDIANKASMASGLAEDFLGVYGNTIDELWDDATGRSIAKG